MGVIYTATFPNGYKYVGQTSCGLNVRINQHKSDWKNRNNGKTIPFYNAINKYGFDSLVWDIIDTYSDKQEGNEKEIYWIDKLRTYVHFTDCKGYNATLGGDSRANFGRLNENQLREIGNLYRENHSAQELADKYQIPLWTMQAIFRGEQWSDYTLIEPRPSYIPHGSIYKPNEVDEILQKFKELGNISHVANWFIDKYQKGSKTSIRDIIKGLTWTEYTGITSEDFYNRYIQIGTRTKNSGKGHSTINQDIALEIRKLYQTNSSYVDTYKLIASKYSDLRITYTIVRNTVRNQNWNNN